MKKFFVVLAFSIPLFCHAQLLGPEPFNSDILVHGTTAPTTVWFAPSSNPAISFVATSGCPDGRIGYSGSWNNYWGNFVRLPQVNASGMDSLKLSFDISHSYSASTTNDWIRFYIWADGGYQKVVSTVTINGVDVLYDFGVNGKGFKFTELRSCAAAEVVFDLSTIVDKTSILIYLEPNCAYNNSSVYSVYFDNIEVSSAANTPFAVSCRPDTAFCVDHSAWTLSGCTPVGGTYSGAGVSAGSFDPAVAGVGTHIIKYVATDGIDTDSCYFNIEVNANPAISISVLPNDTVCEGVQLTLTASGGVSHLWSNGITNGVPFTPASQAYFIQVLDANGCQADSSIDITVNQIPSVLLNLPWDTLCTNVYSPYPEYPLSGGIPAGGVYSGTDIFDGLNITANGLLGNRNSVVFYTYTDVHGCSAIAQDSVYFSDCLTGIENSENPVWNIFPNPTENTLIVQYSGTIASYSIVSVYGEVVESASSVRESTIVVNTSSLNPGVYSIIWIDANGTQGSAVFVKQ